MARPVRSVLQRVPAHLAEHEDDEQGVQRGYIKGTDHAPPYVSQWSRLHDAELRDGTLRHLNCSYLSTSGAPPTLLALKQHVQSLCALIYLLNPTLSSGEINTGNSSSSSDESDASDSDESSEAETRGPEFDPLGFKYQLNDAFDFLADLSVPYTNDNPSHHKPLLALANEVRARHASRGNNSYHCPFAEAPAPRGQGERAKPLANHHNLILHTNACLERLDHEFSATGGIMSILPHFPPADPDPSKPPAVPGSSSQPPPPNEAAEDLTNARNTLLGQWLHFTQSIVARMHDLERAYANALDVLAGEAAVPGQYVSSLGSDGRAAAREVVYPQDRWVLAHCGEEVFEMVHGLLDRREAVMQARERVFLGNGVVGEGLLRRGASGRGESRGIVHVDVTTRYYRIAGQGKARSTLFVLPAWQHHPGVEATRETEPKPTVVACAQPKWPLRATELEKRYTEKIDWAQQVELEDMKLRHELEDCKEERRVLERHNEMLAWNRDALMLVVGEEGVLETAQRIQEVRDRATRAEREAIEARKERDSAMVREEELREGMTRLQRDLLDLTKEVTELREEAAKARRERDAAVARR